MNATLLSFGRHGPRLSSLALGAVLLTACDNDRPLGPNPATLPSAAALGKGPTKGVISIAVVDQNKNAVASAGAEFTLTSGATTITAIDNGAGDSDPTTGILFVKGLMPGVYDVCEKVVPAGYVMASPTCDTATVLPGVTTPLQFFNPTAPLVAWEAQDAVTLLGVGGTMFSGDDGSGSVAIADNSPLDLDPTPGKFRVMVKGASFTVCPKTAPAGWVFYQNPPCATTATPAGQTITLAPFYVAPEASAYWWSGVSGSPGGLGTEYTVTAASGGFSITVVNNGLNDMADPAFMLYVKLPAPGWYTICQTVAPAGGQLADPVCRRVEVPLGHPQYAGFFDSKPI